MKFVHVLMLEAFKGLRPEGCQALHSDDVKANNLIDNLRWGTHAENYADRVKNGGGNHGSRHGMAKINEADVAAIRAAYLPGETTHREIATRFGISRECVGLIVRKERWAHV